jgi:o-succinylbenzoate---CoA ligase
MEYLFETININKKEVSITSIVNQKINTTDQFESVVFSFIRDWLSSKQNFVQETSGSTGVPKQIEINREQFIKSARATLKFLSIKSGGNALVCMDPAFIAGKMMLVRAFEGNLKIIVVSPNANPLHGLASDTKIELSAMVPYQVHSIFQDDNIHLAKSIEHLLIGGAKLNSTLEQELIRHQINAYETFGMTETISHIALRKTGEPYFKILPDINISKDERSCLVIHADYLGKGAIVSNDMVELVNQNKFKWIGRWDNVINSGGIKIIPEVEEPIIEEVLKELNIPNRFYLGSRNSNKLGMEVILYIESKLKEEIPKDIVLKKLKEKLLPYHAPAAIIIKPSFSETKNGKIIRD